MFGTLIAYDIVLEHRYDLGGNDQGLSYVS